MEQGLGPHQRRELQFKKDLEGVPGKVHERQCERGGPPSGGRFDEEQFEKDDVWRSYYEQHGEACKQLGVPSSTTPAELDAIEKRASEIRIETAARRAAAQGKT